MVSKLLLTPQQASYSHERTGGEVVRTSLKGGSGRYRRDISNSSRMVSVSWLLDEYQYQYINAFYLTTIKQGSLAFYIDLIIDTPSPQQFTARMMPDSFKLDSIRGLSYTVSAMLEVTPLPVNDSLNEIIVALYEGSGDNGSNLLNQLEHLVNVDLPEYF